MTTRHTNNTASANCMIHKEIGSGTFSKIYQITRPNTLDPQKSFALKLLSPFHAHLVDNEKGALRKIPEHKNIIKCFDDFDEMVAFGRIWKAVLLEYAAAGDLFSMVSKGKLTEELAQSYYNQMLSALTAAHSVHVYHRDIKLENILIGQTGEILICDWGLSSISQDGIAHTTTLVGTIGYMEPSMFIQNNIYSMKDADLWAALCVFFTCIIGHPPFIKASMSDYHYSCIVTDPHKFWMSIGKYNSSSKKFTDISPELAEFFAEKFQRK
jgi:5'-AMP-activated protein kinase catalytic alpha subunit